MKDYPFSNLNDPNENTSASFDDIKWGSRSDIVLVVALVLIAGLIAKIPAILGISEEFFYTRNVGFIVFPALTAFFVFKNRLSKTHIRVITLFTLVALIFINSLPDVKESDTLILSSIHILLLLWAVLGFTFTGGRKEKFIPIFNYNKQAKDKADAKFSLSNQPEKNIQLSENSRLSNNSPLEFLKYNGDLIVMSTLILIAGGIMSAITIGLFNLIGL
ncbi:MAG: hypothetical protein Q7262_02375, partial [Bacteroidales bacterium]|nr:hypothetical protein [Bacteroidales bacterium]